MKITAFLLLNLLFISSISSAQINIHQFNQIPRPPAPKYIPNPVPSQIPEYRPKQVNPEVQTLQEAATRSENQKDKSEQEQQQDREFRLKKAKNDANAFEPLCRNMKAQGNNEISVRYLCDSALNALAIVCKSSDTEKSGYCFRHEALKVFVLN